MAELGDISETGTSPAIAMVSLLFENETISPTNTSLNATEDEYEYNYDDAIANVSLEELIPVAIVYGLTLILGIVGNLLVIFSIARYRRMRNVTNIFLTSLASADLMLILLCVPVKFAKWFSFTWTFGEFLCKAVHFLQNISVICSVLTLTMMSIERYFAILHPLRAKYVCTKSRAKKVIFAIWITSCVLAAPIIFGQTHKEVGWVRKGYWCLKEWPNVHISRVYELLMLLFIFIVPIQIMIFAYASICRELWVMTSRRAEMRADHDHHEYYECDTSSSRSRLPGTKTPILRHRIKKSVKDDDKTRKQVIKMLVAVILLFAICWGPTFVDNVLIAFGVLEKLNYGILKHIRQAFALMSYFNSCINPIVYAFMSKNFRDSFKNALCTCLYGNECNRSTRFGRQMSFQTSVSMTNTHSVKIDSDYGSDERLIKLKPTIARLQYRDGSPASRNSETML